MSQLRRNVLTNYIARFATIFGLFLLFPFVAHHVGLSVYGIYLLISSMTMFFTLDFGMGTATIRYVAAAWTMDDRPQLSRVISSSLAFFIALAVALAVVFALSMIVAWPSLHIPESERSTALQLLVVVGVGQLLIAIPLGVFNQVLIGIGRLDVMNVLQLVQLALRVVATVGLLSLGYGIVAVAISEGILAIGLGIAAWIASKRQMVDVPVNISRAEWRIVRSMAPFSLQLFVISVAALVILQADSLIISLFLPVAAVTLYGAAYRIYQVTREMTNALTLALVPAATARHVQDHQVRLQELFLKATRYSNVLVLLFSVPGLLFAGIVLEAWGGPAFRPGTEVMQILLLSQLFNNNHLVAISILTGRGNVKAYARYHALWAAANIILSVILIQSLGLRGVALGTAIPIILLEPLYVATVLKQLRLRAKDFVLGILLPSFAPAAVAGLPLWLMARSLHIHTLFGALVASAVWTVVFGAIVYRVGIEPDDRARILRMLRRIRVLRATRDVAHA
jgi:O-antigen/teichoic acid export membrane protein